MCCLEGRHLFCSTLVACVYIYFFYFLFLPFSLICSFVVFLFFPFSWSDFMYFHSCVRIHFFISYFLVHLYSLIYLFTLSYFHCFLSLYFSSIFHFSFIPVHSPFKRPFFSLPTYSFLSAFLPLLSFTPCSPILFRMSPLPFSLSSYHFLLFHSFIHFSSHFPFAMSCFSLFVGQHFQAKETADVFSRTCVFFSFSSFCVSFSLFLRL